MSQVFDMLVDYEGNYLLGGHTTVGEGVVNWDYLALKISSQGEELWHLGTAAWVRPPVDPRQDVKRGAEQPGQLAAARRLGGRVRILRNSLHRSNIGRWKNV